MKFSVVLISMIASAMAAPVANVQDDKAPAAELHAREPVPKKVHDESIKERDDEHEKRQLIDMGGRLRTGSIITDLQLNQKRDEGLEERQYNNYPMTGSVWADLQYQKQVQQQQNQQRDEVLGKRQSGAKFLPFNGSALGDAQYRQYLQEQQKQERDEALEKRQSGAKNLPFTGSARGDAQYRQYLQEQQKQERDERLE